MHPYYVSGTVQATGLHHQRSQPPAAKLLWSAILATLSWCVPCNTEVAHRRWRAHQLTTFQTGHLRCLFKPRGTKKEPNLPSRPQAKPTTPPSLHLFRPNCTYCRYTPRTTQPGSMQMLLTTDHRPPAYESASQAIAASGMLPALQPSTTTIHQPDTHMWTHDASAERPRVQRLAQRILTSVPQPDDAEYNVVVRL